MDSWYHSVFNNVQLYHLSTPCYGFTMEERLKLVSELWTTFNSMLWILEKWFSKISSLTIMTLSTPCYGFYELEKEEYLELYQLSTPCYGFWNRNP